MIRFLLLFLLLAGCDFPGEDDASALTYTPVFDASTFEADVTHPFFTLVGNVFRQYQGQTPEGLKTIQTVVTGTRRTVAGVSTTVVRDRVFVDGLQVGLVFRWYAQDAAGNVWHLGTEANAMEDDRIVGTDGWEAGLDGATAGIVMPASPEVGQRFERAFADDAPAGHGEVLAIDVAVSVRAGDYSGCIRTRETTPTFEGMRTTSVFCPDVGLVLEEHPTTDSAIELMETLSPT